MAAFVLMIFILNPFHATGLSLSLSLSLSLLSSPYIKIPVFLGFLMFLSGIERDQWHQIGLKRQFIFHN